MGRAGPPSTWRWGRPWGSCWSRQGGPGARGSSWPWEGWWRSCWGWEALLTFLMGFTDHAVTYGNENALLVSFLALLLAFVLRPASHGSPRAGRLASGLAVAVGGLAVVA